MGGPYVTPKKVITSEADIEKFKQSEAGTDLVGFIAALGDAVVGKKLSDECHVSPASEALLAILEELEGWLQEFPPIQQEMRFGNTAFRQWHDKLEATSREHMLRLLPAEHADAEVELSAYWCDSFGNKTRIDYGTGHETCFGAFLFCLAKLGVFGEEDRHALVLRVFTKYLRLMRLLQTTYWLEPAGSHGVWGLDDYQFLPYIWGAAQLIGHKYIRPKSIHNEDTMEGYAREFLYLGCVEFIKSVKKGRLQETSPMINDISGVPKWEKVNSGLMKMYAVEVMGKVPIMQHFLFGSLIKFPDGESEAS